MLVPHCLRSGCRQWIVLATNINTLHNLYVDIRGCEVLHPGGYRSAKLLNTADEILREEVAVWGRNPCEELKIAQLERKGLEVPPAEKSYLLGHRRAFSLQKPLQSVLSRRSFSTETDGDDGFNAQISDADLIDTKGFEGVVFGDSGLWMQNVEIKANNFNRELAVDSLKAEFERDFRPLLAFHCLMLPHSVDHYTTAYCHGPAHGSTNLRTLYLSSLDVMVRMRTLKKWQRKFLLDHIIQRRILIVDDWEHSYANIEMLEYDFGTSNTDSVRGECDASFQVDKLNQGGVGKACGSIIHSGKSKFAIIIWKGRQVLWAGIYEGIPCNDSHHAEVQAALALLMKCEEMKFSSVELRSDSRRACGVINGSETIQMNDTNRDTCLLLQSMRKRFTKVVAIQKPRELMFLADGLLRSDWYSGCFFKKAMGSWAPYLRGCPLFKVTNNHTTSKIIKSFEQTRTNKERRGYTYSPETTFYWKVKKDRKLEELERLREFLEAACMRLVVEAFEEEPLLLRKHLAVLYPESKSHAGITTLQYGRVVDPRQRALVVVWNASIPRAKYYRQDSCTIIMVDDEEVKEMKRLRINEINIETYLYFHRGEYKPGA